MQSPGGRAMPVYIPLNRLSCNNWVRRTGPARIPDLAHRDRSYDWADVLSVLHRTLTLLPTFVVLLLAVLVSFDVLPAQVQNRPLVGAAIIAIFLVYLVG